MVRGAFFHASREDEILANLCLAADTRGDHSDVSSLLVEPSSERLVKILLFLTPC